MSRKGVERGFLLTFIITSVLMAVLLYLYGGVWYQSMKRMVIGLFG